MIEHLDDVWHGYAIHHHLAFHAAVAKMRVLVSPCLPSAAGESVSQDKETNMRFQTQPLKIRASGGGSPGRWKMWAHFLLL